MSIKELMGKDGKKFYEVMAARRVPKGEPLTLRRKTNFKGEVIRTKSEALRMKEKLKDILRDKIKEGVVLRWSDLVLKYRDHCIAQGHSLKGVDNAYVCLKGLTFGLWGNQFIDKITTDEVRTFIRDGMNGKSASHKKSLLKYIRLCFKYAVECGHLDRNPAPEMKFGIGQKLMTVLSLKNASYFLRKAKEIGCEWHPIWAGALYTGMRNGELIALRWENIDFENNKIKVCESWNSKDGLKSTKSGNDRYVDIAPDFRDVLFELKKESIDNFVFPKVRGWEKGEQARELRRFLEGVGLEPIRFHDLRASWATINMQNGVEPIKVMKMAGWADIKTMDRYVRLAGIDTSRALENLSLKSEK